MMLDDENSWDFLVFTICIYYIQIFMSEVVDGNPFFAKSMLAYHPLFRQTHIPERSINKTYNETMHRPIRLFSACLIGISIWSELPRPDGFRPHLGFSWSWSPGLVVYWAPSKSQQKVLAWHINGLLGLIGAAHRKAQNQCKQTQWWNLLHGQA